MFILFLEVIKMSKNFYKSHKQIIWTVVIMLILFAAVSGFNKTTSFGQMDSSVRMEESYYKGAGFAETSSLRMDDSASAPTEGERKIRHTANVNLEIKKSKYEETKSAVLTVPEQFKGFYTSQSENKRTYKENDYKTYRLTFKVPVESFDMAIAAVKELADVKSLNVYADDLTTSYADAKAYLESYKKEKARIEQLLNKANKIPEIIQIEEKLMQLQRTIDRYQQQITNIDRQTDYSQISVVLEEKQPLSESFYRWTGIREHLRNIVRGFDSVLVVITNLIGWVIAIGIIWWIVKIIRKKV